MKSLKTLAVAAVCSMVIQALPNLAHAGEGNSSGGGQGDHAFALQQLAQANPGLKPEQVLFRAFQQSQGRVPAIRILGTSGGHDSASFLPEFIVGSFVISVEYPTGRSSAFFGLARQQAPDAGPLLTMPDGAWTLYAQDGDDFTNGPWPEVTLGPTGLIAKTHPNYETGHNMAPEVQIEFRQYTADIVIFAVKPKPGHPQVCAVPAYNKIYQANADGLCAIGYFWR